MFQDQSPKDLGGSIPKILKDCSLRQLAELIQLMTRLNPAERITLEEVNVRLRHLHSKLTEPRRKSKSNLSPSNDINGRTDATLPRLPPKAFKTEESLTSMVETRSYRLHRSLKKMKRNPEKHRYDYPFGINSKPCCSPFRKHREMINSKLTYYASTDPRFDNPGISSHLFK